MPSSRAARISPNSVSRAASYRVLRYRVRGSSLCQGELSWLGHPMARERTSARPAGGADFGVCDLVGQQRVDLRGLGGGVPRRLRTTSMETPALISSVAWEWRSWWMSMTTPAAAQYFCHPVVRRGIRQRSAGAVDAGAEHRPGGVAGAGEV